MLVSKVELATLSPEQKQIVSEMQALTKRIQSGEFLAVVEVGLVLTKFLANVPVETTDPFIRNLVLFSRLAHHKDYTLLLETGERLIAEENFESWVRLVIRVQDAYLKDNFSIPNSHPTWVEFSRQMGLVPHATLQELFNQSDFEWISAKSLERHFRIRVERKELDIQSEEELVQVANRFLQVQSSSHVIYQRKDGFIFKYDYVTKELALLSPDGKIITYYTVIDKYRKFNSKIDYIGRAFLGLPPPTERKAKPSDDLESHSQ
jgi:hypothetical protein